MTKNMGTADRVIRIALALIIVGLFFAGRIHGVVAIVLLVVAAVFLVTGLVSRCPGYVPLGMSTRRGSSGSTG